jgi:hypothetical protein
MPRSKPPRKGIASSDDAKLCGPLANVNRVKVIQTVYTDKIKFVAFPVEWAAISEVVSVSLRSQGIKNGTSDIWWKEYNKWKATLDSYKPIGVDTFEAIVYVRRK